MTNKARFTFGSEPISKSGKFGINRNGRHGNFALQRNQPCDYLIKRTIIIEKKKKNTFPLTNSHRVTPQLHQSASNEYPGSFPMLDMNTSGAK